MKLDALRLLHFAPEKHVFRRLRHNPDYVGGDIQKRRKRTHHVDITRIDFPDQNFDAVMANHVLEHVKEDAQAMRECFRVLRPGGVGIFSVPILGNRSETWDPPADMPAEEIERICGWDHVRLYGMDFADRLADVGFDVEAVAATPQERRDFSILEEDIIFLARRPSTSARGGAAIAS